MARVIWAPQAFGDLVRLRRFLATENPRAAMAAMAAIRRRVQDLVLFPHSGRFVHEGDESLREWLVPFSNSGYVVLYEVRGNDVTIARVRHMREAGYRPPGSDQP